jgi:hypothetical protein
VANLSVDQCEKDANEAIQKATQALTKALALAEIAGYGGQGFCRNKVEELELRWHLPSNQKAKL